MNRPKPRVLHMSTDEVSINYRETSSRALRVKLSGVLSRLTLNVDLSELAEFVPAREGTRRYFKVTIEEEEYDI